MELCRKPIVSACSPKDWIVGMDFDGLEVQEDGGNDYITDINNKMIDLTYPGTTTSIPKKPNELNIYEISVLLPAGNATINGQDIKLNLYDWNALKPPQFKGGQGNAGGVYLADRLLSGTTSRPARFVEDQAFPRRVAFLRNADAKILTNTTGNPASIGVAAKPTGNSTTSKNQDEQHDTLGCFVVNGSSITLNSATVGVNVPGSTNPQTCGNNTPRLREAENSLWFRTRANNNTMSFNADNPLWLYNPVTPGTARTF
ncbi:hypothetical protein, partial [Planktothrix sp.]|uniref:hypothetical protein n=1 Tax=Planktothrix sp. TaxID=3088171 RepID=UPI0038D3E64E